jgi:tetratricopeptide (TPR) repeat protein
LKRARRALGEERPAANAQAAKAPTPMPARPNAAVDEHASAEARAAYKRGFQLFVDGRPDDAIAEYRSALESDPGLAIAWNGLSIAHRQKGELDEAIEAGRHLIQINPKDPLSHTNLSILLMRKGMIPEAEEERAIAMQMQMRSQRES